ncbi:MAG: hypothetical protein IJW89_02475 [Clostridia bacterium]|nr:hypothetical protein [Clostridia bacterium]
MSKTLKSVVCLLMSLLLLMPLSVTASAASAAENQVQPRWSYTDMTYVGLSIKPDGTATCVADVMGYDGITTKVHIEMTLQKYTFLWWSKVQSWEATFNDVVGTLSRTIQVDDSDTYRVKAIFTVYSGSNSEEITSYSQEYEFEMA